MMATRRQMEAMAAREIKAQTAPHYPAIRARLARLQPLEAMVLLGNLAVETLARFPPGERIQLADGWIEALLEDVRNPPA